MFERFIALLAPHVCVVCSNEGAVLCEWCGVDRIGQVASRCYRCLRLSRDARVCVSCRRQSSLANVWVRALYGDVARELLYVLKFARARAAAKTIALLLDETVPYLPEDMIVSYVPTATKRVRIRGYDQTRCIALEFARLRNLKCKRLLVRHGQARQVGATRAERLRQAAGNYSAVNASGLDSVLLIDDILTTGATLESAALILRNAGVRRVYGAVFAQKQ